MNDKRVRDVMTSLVVVVYPQDSIQYVASRLVRNRISGAPVVADGKVVGVVSEVDIAHALLGPARIDRGLETSDVLSLILRTVPTRHEHTRVVADVMSTPVETIGPDDSLYKAAQLLDHRGIKRLPVVDGDGYLLGIISRGDLVRAMLRTDADIAIDVLATLEILGEEALEGLSIDVTNGVVSLSGIVDRRTTRDICIDRTARVAGVTEVVDRLDFETDDTTIRPVRNPIDGREIGRDPWAVGPLVKEA